MAGKKRRQQVMDELVTPPTKKTVESSLIGSQKLGSKEVDAVIASFFYENGISFNVANSSSFGRMIDEGKNWQWWECVFCLRLFLRPHANEIGLLPGTSTRRSETGWSLQPLKSLYMFTQTAKWWQQVAILTNSRCLLGIMKMLERSSSETASDPAACNSRPSRNTGYSARLRAIIQRVTAGPAREHAAPHEKCSSVKNSESRALTSTRSARCTETFLY